MITTPMCAICKHMTQHRGVGCRAFPGGIPLAILHNHKDHRKPVEGDHGLQFEQIEPQDESDRAWIEVVKSSSLLSEKEEL